MTGTALDSEYLMIDGTIIRVHQQGTGATGRTHRQPIGRSRGGLTTKIVALVDALGNLACFIRCSELALILGSVPQVTFRKEHCDG